ncbi:aminotransferase class IV [Actinomadura macrotermitis]|uniref:Aminotransferase class IV n=1 Tax=Actinomadura macrotermitis TaxID=2585200 RepID=A0A7K0C053_9ACTN|nr:aminotransferase class IV [Actinomadura macrotermitis]MQY06462.1 hypothetical protein [Actinomadura macrotermitis]
MSEPLIWKDGFVPGSVPDEPPLAADSWLVQEGRARGLDRHRARFAGACGTDVSAFWTAVLGRLPATGEWFPRVELADTDPPVLALRLRPAPPRGETIGVWVPDTPDPRRHPRRKGPDLDVLGDLRAEARRHGADEALLVTPDGIVLEGATTSLVWWEEDRLCFPEPDLPVLPSVTAGLIRDEALTRGVPVAHGRPRLPDLAGRETWLVNALHGIRPVTAWAGTPFRPGPPHRAAHWRRWWDGLAAPWEET